MKHTPGHNESMILTFMDHMLVDAIVMALYIHGSERPVYMDEHIEHCRQTFGITFDRWRRHHAQ